MRVHTTYKAKKPTHKIPELVLKAERLGMISKPGYHFVAYSIGISTAAEMIYQLKIFLGDAKLAYKFFREQFRIDKSQKHKLEVIYKKIKEQQ